MKGSSKSVLAFLIVWLVVLMAGYLLSRDRVFAAGTPPPPCAQCQYCQEFSQFQSSVGSFGYTAKGTNTPWVTSALNGTLSGGSLDLFTGTCNNAGEAAYYSPAVPLTIWSIIGGSNTCQPASPPPDGLYERENSTVTSGSGNINQSFCANTD